MVKKVSAYITRRHHGELQVLVHEHRDAPEAGLQVPAGTVEPGEEIEAALWREIEEESGLQELTLIGLIAHYDYWNLQKVQWQQRHVFHLTATVNLPETWSHAITGQGEDAGLMFVYRWMPLADAEERLAADHGRYLHRLTL